MQEISCTRGPENKPGAAIPAYPRQGHSNNTHTPRPKPKSSRCPGHRERSGAGLCPPQRPRAHGKGTYGARMPSPALPPAVLLPSSPQAAPGLEVLLAAPLPASLQRRLLLAALLRNAIAASSSSSRAAGTDITQRKPRAAAPQLSRGGCPT